MKANQNLNQERQGNPGKPGQEGQQEQQQQGGDVGELASLRGFSACNFYLPLSSSTVQVFPANDVAIYGAEFVKQGKRIMIVNEDKAVANRQLFEKLDKHLMSFNGDEYAHVQLFGALSFIFQEVVF